MNRDELKRIAIQCGNFDAAFLEAFAAAIEAIVIAAQSDQEPVAWLNTRRNMAFASTTNREALESPAYQNGELIPLFTHPPVAQEQDAITQYYVDRNRGGWVSLSQRVRPNVEAAPWVIEEIKKLEASLPVAQEVDERKEAEHQYTISAFNYPDAPVGSRDWTLYWNGWQARAALSRIKEQK